MARPKGLPKTGGRQKGTPNKRTKLARETAQLFLDSVPQERLQRLFLRAEKEDPVGALRIYYTALEFCAPKLARVEQTGPDGKSPVVEVRHVQLTFDGGRVPLPVAVERPVLPPPPDEENL